MEVTSVNAVLQDKLPQVAALCQRHHVARLDLFGSGAMDRFKPGTSDLDFLVEYLPGATAGFGGDFFALKSDLEALFGCAVDLVDHASIRNPYFREEVEQTRVRLYAA